MKILSGQTLSTGEAQVNKMDEELLTNLTDSLDDLSDVMKEQSQIVSDIKNLLLEYIHNINKPMEDFDL